MCARFRSECLPHIALRIGQQASKAVKLRNLSQRERNYNARAGEGDRAITTKMVCGTSWILNLLALTCLHSQSIFSLGNAKLAKLTGDNSDMIHCSQTCSCLFVTHTYCSLSIKDRYGIYRGMVTNLQHRMQACRLTKRN